MNNSDIKQITTLLADLKARDSEAASLVASILGVKLAILFMYEKLKKLQVEANTSPGEIVLTEVMKVLGVESAAVLIDELKDNMKIANPTLHDIVGTELREINEKL